MSIAPSTATPIVFVDVQYAGDRGVVACLVARSWADASPVEERIATIEGVSPYRPGAFYERELPCIIAGLSHVRTPFTSIVIDGYVTLDANQTPGLGAHLYSHLGGRTIVIGVAKTAFRGAAFARPVLRGASHSPLFITAQGLPVEDAASLVTQMHGNNRLPTLLVRVDHLARALKP